MIFLKYIFDNLKSCVKRSIAHFGCMGFYFNFFIKMIYYEYRKQKFRVVLF